MTGRAPKPSVGMTNPVTAVGKPCQWCGSPATQIVTVRPQRFVNNEMVEQAITAATCDEHAKLAQEHAKGFEQTSILDDAGAPRSAIYGDAA